MDLNTKWQRIAILTEYWIKSEEFNKQEASNAEMKWMWS
jgi:hypothetical protein